jgi:dTDP-4-dehydrorhamnose reductase
MKKVLILGSQGTLGTALVKLYPEGIGWDRDDIDVTDFPALRAKVSGAGYTPDAVINCVAFNDVDGAEERSELAFSLNADFPGRLAQFTKELGIPLIHYSTNYVFDGVRGEYAEGDAPSPLSAYGRSKLQGERLVAENGGQWYIVRTAVLFGPKGNSPLSKKSFVEIMLDLSSKREVIQAVSDEINSLTYAPDLAQHTRALLASSPAPGVYHIVNSGSASWFDFAREIFRIAGKSTTVLPVPSTHFPRKATRPRKAILLNTKLPPVRPWTEALAAFLSRFESRVIR